MSDSTGTPSPPGVPWPRHWRIWWDPKAPHGTGAPSDLPTIDSIPAIIADNPPMISGTGSPGCQVAVTFIPNPGDAFGVVIVGDDGTWSYTPSQPLPTGDYCVQANQRCESPGGWSAAAEECFTLTEIAQNIDFEAKRLRYDSVNGWATYGTLAYKVNGTWTYGTLRRVVEVVHG